MIITDGVVKFVLTVERFAQIIKNGLGKKQRTPSAYRSPLYSIISKPDFHAKLSGIDFPPGH
jgi:hypothetical protein